MTPKRVRLMNLPQRDRLVGQIFLCVAKRGEEVEVKAVLDDPLQKRTIELGQMISPTDYIDDVSQARLRLIIYLQNNSEEYRLAADKSKHLSTT